MENKAYELIEKFEDWFWWNRARKNIIIDTILNNIDNVENKKLLDIGCGSGDFLSSISKSIPNSIGIEGYEYQEIARMMHLSESGVRSQYMRARRRLADAVRKMLDI